MQTLPSKEQIDQKIKDVEDIIKKEKKEKCQYMYNLLTQTINDAVKDTSVKTKTTYSNTINNLFFTNIRECEEYQEYNKELKKRGIEVNQSSCNNNTIIYNVLNKTIFIV